MLQIFMIVLFTLLLKPALAQAPQDGSGKGERREEMKRQMEELEAKLNLTPEQRTKIEEIKKRNRDEAKGKMMALPADAAREEKGRIMKDAMIKADAEIMELLNTEQQSIYKAEKEKIKEQKKEKRMERKKANGK